MCRFGTQFIGLHNVTTFESTA